MADDRTVTKVGVRQLKLRIANDLAELSRVAEGVEEFCAKLAIPAGNAFKLNVAIEELLTNTISYGYDDTGRHEIGIDIKRERETIVVELSDDARPFDPLNAPPPDLESAIEDRRIGGLGVHLVKTLMDDVAYAYRDGHNHITLRKKIEADSDDG
ncbi:MAG TPA: ATP-binding protein [Stellaceae bacterium]|jgi:serine/threonine-protein kinase RsbW|nr:ATP-binding protein [Stellaceae bacterium]